MPEAFPTIGIVGSGAIGCYYGAHLVRAGANVRFLMRADLEAVRHRGSILVHGSSGTLEARPVLAFATPEEVGPVDLAVVALKTTAPEGVRAVLSPVVGPATTILTLQNGLGADEHLGAIFGSGRVVGGLVFMAITRTAPGEVTCFHPGSVSVGELTGPAGVRTRAVAALLGGTGIRVQVVDNLLEARWRKLVWNIPFNGLSVAERVTTDAICADARLSSEARALMLEVQRAASAFGIAIPDEFVARQFEVTPAMGPYRPSSLVDFLSGREVEVEAIWGEPLRRAARAGVAMPRLGALYSRLASMCARPLRPSAPR